MATRRLARTLSVFTVLSALAVEPCHAQFKADPVESRLSSGGAIARRYLSRGTGDEQQFREYIEKYYFPAMTQPDAEGLGDLERLHEDLFKNFLYKSSGPTQKYLHDQAMELALKVLRDSNYHPSVRYNALLIAGKLDDRYPTDSSPSVPSARGNDMLVALATRAAENGRAPRYELVGSLIGLERHAKLLGGMPADQKRNTARTLHKVLTTDELPGEYAPGVRDWIYLRAATAASYLGPMDSRGVFTAAIGKRVADASLSLETRATIAAMLGRLEPKSGQPNGQAIVKSVVSLAAKVAEEEAEIATKFEDMQIRGGSRYTVGRGKESRRITTTVDREVELLREGLLDLLIDLRKGVRAVEPIADEATKPKVAAINTALNDAIRAAGDKNTIDLNVADQVKQMAAVIKDASAEPAPAEEPAAEDDAGLASAAN